MRLLCRPCAALLQHYHGVDPEFPPQEYWPDCCGPGCCATEHRPPDCPPEPCPCCKEFKACFNSTL